MKTKLYSFIFVVCLACVHPLFGQLVVHRADSIQNPIADSLVRTLAGYGISISNVKTNLKGNTRSLGTFKNSNPGFPISRGLMLSSGFVDTVAGSNSNKILSCRIPASDTIAGMSDGRHLLAKVLNSYGLPSITRRITDVASIKFDLVPIGDSVQFKYIFSSEEYPQFVCSNFNDLFGFFIKGPGIIGDSLFNGTPYEGYRNMAIIPGTNLPVSINTVNSGVTQNSNPANCIFTPQGINSFVKNDSAYHSLYSFFKMNGLTKVLEAKAHVFPCETYTLILAIADAMDQIYDSNVFLEMGSLVSGNYCEFRPASMNGLNDTITSCHPGKLLFKRCESALQEKWVVKFTIEGTAQPNVDFKRLMPNGTLVPFPNQISLLPGQKSDSIMIQAIGNQFEVKDIVLRFLNIQNPFAFGQPNYSGQSINLKVRPIPTRPENNMAVCWFDSASIPFSGPELDDLTYLWKEWKNNQEVEATLLSCVDCRTPIVVSDTLSHTYKVSISNASCQYQDTVRVEAKRFFLPQFLFGQGWIQLSNPQPGYSYQWLINEQLQSGNATDPITYNPGDLLTFKTIAPNGCFKDVAHHEIFTHVKPRRESVQKPVIFPNPSSSVVQILPVDKGSHFIRLIGVDQKVHFERRFDTENISLDLKEFPIGFYGLEIMALENGNRYVLKLLRSAD